MRQKKQRGRAQTKECKAIARWRAFYFTLFIGTLLPLLGFMWVLDKSPIANQFLVLSTFWLEWRLLAIISLGCCFLYFIAYFYLLYKHRCPFCKETWVFVLHKPINARAIKEYNCLCCGHRELYS